MSNQTLNLWVLLTREKDLPGWWVAHCLDLDVVTQGHTLAHAVEMVKEAAEMVITDDLARGLDPLSRRAPAADWDALHLLQRDGLPTNLTWYANAAHELDVVSAAFQIRTEAGQMRALESVWALPQRAHG